MVHPVIEVGGGGGYTSVTCFILLMDFIIHNQHCKILEIKAKSNEICREGH